ncbi:hypothetical protein BU17DRAFT_36962 [Hysterangium stoloniferum]|nr:hypothetical protein BU17DRAFT_36962 [Hysterangium stoloniferum]
MTGEQEEYIAVLKALYDYEPTSEDELQIKEDQILFLVEKTDDEWWKVKHKPDSQEDETAPSGLVPASYLEEAVASSLVKAIYDYEAAAPGELSVIENEVLSVYDQDEDWLLVKSERDGGKVGYVPGNYVEEVCEGPSVENDAAHIVIPDSVCPPSRPVSEYVDPADRVAATAGKAKADNIETWSVSEVDKKGKKKKGTLGVGNGAIFFASESDKTPVQKWQTSDVIDMKIEKSKHLHLEIAGNMPVSLHFSVGSKDVAEAIVRKLESSRSLSNGTDHDQPSIRQTSPPPTSPSLSPLSISVPVSTPKGKKNGASVHFAAVPAVIPAPETPVDAEPGEEEVEMDGEAAVALYDFIADNEDELSVSEGEKLVILDKVSSEEWWKCRNVHGAEGVVPASYVEEQEQEQEQERAAQEEMARNAERAAAEIAAQVQARERAEKEKERKREEAERQAKAIAKAEKERQDADRERERAVPKFPNEGKTRIWRDHSGQWHTEAEFLGINKGKIRLHKINGVVIEVPPEKMSPDDVRYLESITGKKLSSQAPPTSRLRAKDDDDVPLALTQRRSPRPTPPLKKTSTIDWFEFFLNAGCEVDDCTRYASAFERDKIDEAILPDIKDSTLRSLGLREGDIIRVIKAIDQRKGKSSGRADDEGKKAQMARDEELARALQAEEDGSSSHRANLASPPNLFTGPGGTLKAQPRRGRPQPRGSAPPVNVDVSALASASEQISRTGSPLVASPGATAARTASPAVNPPKPSNTLQPSGFDDDAWVIRPTSAPPAASPIAPPPPPPPPPPPVTESVPRAVSTPAAPTAPVASQKPSEQPVQPPQDTAQFDILAKIGQMRPPSVPAPSLVARPSQFASSTPQVISTPPQGFNAGLGVGSSPIPLGQHLQNQQTGLYQTNGPRGPLAPVPSNQGLLNPLIPTTTGFNQFVPTRPASNPPMQPSQFQSSPSLPFLSTAPTGFGSMNPLMSQPTGFTGMATTSNSFSGINSQPTGFGSGFGSLNPNFMPPSGYGKPPNFNPAFSQPGFNQSVQAPLMSPPKDHSPANVFAQMKSGTFADESLPQSADKYDALRPQPTGWGYQPYSGY